MDTKPSGLGRHSGAAGQSSLNGRPRLDHSAKIPQSSARVSFNQAARPSRLRNLTPKSSPSRFPNLQTARERATQTKAKPAQPRPNLPRDYVMDEPAPLNLDANSTTDERIAANRQRQRRKRIILVLTILFLVIIGGLVGWLWLFWHNYQSDQVEMAESGEPTEAPVATRTTLSLSDAQVKLAQQVIERVKYTNPFLSFYPMGELSLKDLNEAQRQILLGNQAQDPAQAEAGETQYLHTLYAAEQDDERLYLYESILVVRTKTCQDEKNPWLTQDCSEYYNLSQQKLDINTEEIQAADFAKPSTASPDELTESGSTGDNESSTADQSSLSGEIPPTSVETPFIYKTDRYRWTFLKDQATGKYSFEKISRA